MATFTEFYCDPVNGSNLNGGSGNPASEAAPVLTSTAGNWDGTSVFTCTDGPTLTAGMVGKFASIYVTAGATVAAYIARITAIDNSAKTVTVSTTAKAGAKPSLGTGTMTCKVGGAWQGPNAAVNFPALATLQSATDASGDGVRVNLRNNANYAITATIGSANWLGVTFQGYSTAPGDGGKAIIDGGSPGTAFIMISVSAVAFMLADLIVQNNGSTGGSAGGFVLTSASAGATILRCVARNMARAGFTITTATLAGPLLVECEAYNCGIQNPSFGAAFLASSGTFRNRYAHDNAGSNVSGFFVGAGVGGTVTLVGCISESNGADGYLTDVGPGSMLLIGCDAYNNGGNGINAANNGGQAYLVIQNCNLVKNAGWGFTGAGAVIPQAGVITNCGFGSGTMANALGNTTGLLGIVEQNDVIYASGLTPWNAPSTGDFRITLSTAQFAGRGAFTEVGTKTGTVGMPPIGAALFISSPSPPAPGSVMNKAIGITVSASTELVNITGIFAGESVLLTCTYATSTNIAGQVYTLYIRDRANGTVLISYTGSYVNSATGVFTFTIQATDTLNTLGPGTFAYSIESPSVAVAQGIMPLQAK